MEVPRIDQSADQKEEVNLESLSYIMLIRTLKNLTMLSKNSYATFAAGNALSLMKHGMILVYLVKRSAHV